MERASFKQFVAETIEDILTITEVRINKKLFRPPRFQWLGKDPSTSTDIAEEIMERVSAGPDEIRPCVDIGVAALDSTDRPLLIASIAGYPHCPFGQNWTGRIGPFVYIIGAPLLNGVSLDSVPKAPFGFGILPFDPGDERRPSLRS